MALERAESRSRMFQVGGKPMVTWNVFVGCDFQCTYCNARQLALTRLKNSPRYKDGFKPHLVEEELKRTFRPGQFIFVAYMGDISFASQHEVNKIVTRIRQFPETNFLVQSKDPDCFFRLGIPAPQNVYLGTTIETNRDYHLTKAPSPIKRLYGLKYYQLNRKFLSIEPIMDFDIDHLTGWVELLQPDIIEIGADNYHNSLPEPPWEKVEKLLEGLENICPTVVRKVGLERLQHDPSGT